VRRDGQAVLQALQAEGLPPTWRELPAIEGLRTLWQQPFALQPDGQLRWRTADELVASGDRVQAPFDLEARVAPTRTVSWTGYKVFLTETCDGDLPRLIPDVQTTAAPVFDGALTAPSRASARGPYPPSG
jgi:transposase